jgi:hypothetical protein
MHFQRQGFYSVIFVSMGMRVEPFLGSRLIYGKIRLHRWILGDVSHRMVYSLSTGCILHQQVFLVGGLCMLFDCMTHVRVVVMALR